MTTPKSPTEIGGFVPTPTPTPSALTTAAPTPGVSGAAVRHPGAPTLPEWDPTNLAVMLQQAASALYNAPPAPDALPGRDDVTLLAEPPVASASPGVAPTTNETAVAAAPVAPSPSLASPPSAASQPSVPSSPFGAPLDFGALGVDSAFPVAFREPLFDDAPARASTAAPTAPTAAAPPPPEPTQSPRAEAFAIDSFTLLPSATPTGVPAIGSTQFDPHAIRREFPILQQRVNGHRLVWLDNAATTQKPQAVIDRLTRYYETENSNVHRAAHTLAARASDAFEQARETVRRFLNASSRSEIVFVRGATEGINLLAQSWGRRNLQAGDEIVISWLEHHANIVPWQMLARDRGLKIKVAPVDDRGQILLEEYDRLLTDKVKLVSITQVSNALGTITPVAQMIAMAHRHGSKVIVDGAQAVSHQAVDVQALDCDFYVFSGHKIFAPTGIGAVFGKKALLDEMPPWQGGGNMIEDVTFERTVYQPAPMRFEAGTGNIADAVGLGAALDWLMRIGVDNVGRYEHELLEYGTAQLETVPGLTIIGTAAEKAGVLSFILDGQKTETLSGILDRDGIAVRSGHHCAQPILRRFGLEATVRASLAPYNTHEDLDVLVAALKRLQAGR